MNRPLTLLFLALVFVAAPSWAGGGCRQTIASAQQVATATELGAQTVRALDERDAPVALVARIGTDLSRFGLKYSHVGIAVRDHPDGRWSVVHLLNQCGTDHSGIYAEGMANFFLDDLVSSDSAIVWLQPELAARLSQQILDAEFLALHEPHYSVIARPDSVRFQNSTSWVLEELEVAIHQRSPTLGRHAVHALFAADGFQPDVLHIPYSERIAGGLFVANVCFTDHPLAARLGGQYPVVSVQSIFRFLERGRYQLAMIELHTPAAIANPKSV